MSSHRAVNKVNGRRLNGSRLNAHRVNGGFTLLELVVVMGILSGFLVMLVQLLTSGIELFDEGESGQAMADRAVTCSRDTRRCIQDIRGPVEDVRPRDPEARLLVQWVPLGLALGQDGGATRVQVIRAAVDIDSGVERSLQIPDLQLRAEEEVGIRGEQAVAARLDELVAQTPQIGWANMLLLPWPAGDEEGAYLQLRRGLLLPGTLVLNDRDEPVDPMWVTDVGSPELPARVVERITEPIVDGLLHVEFSFWSQYTRRWDGSQRSLAGSGDGPERTWDSARAGLFLGLDGRDGFSLDVGPDSLKDATDDVYPSAVRIDLVVGRSRKDPPDALLAEFTAVDAKQVRVVNPDLLPDGEGQHWIKIGPEWVRYARRDGYVLRGLQRGQRGTKAVEHAEGTGLRIGRNVTMVVRLPFGRDNWNG